MKRILILAAVALLAIAIFPVAAALEITAPTGMSLTVEAYSTGNSPTLDIIDNTAVTAGGNAGTMNYEGSPDRYMIDFGLTEAGTAIIPSRNQRVEVGSCADPIFTLGKTYANKLYIDLWVSELPPEGLVIEVWHDEGSNDGSKCEDTAGPWLDFVIDSTMTGWLLHPSPSPDTQDGFRAYEVINTFLKRSTNEFFLVIKTGEMYTGHDFSEGVPFYYNPTIKIVATETKNRG